MNTLKYFGIYRTSLLLLSAIFLTLMGCSKDELPDPNPGPNPKVTISSAKKIISFQFLATDNPVLSAHVATEINEDKKSIFSTVPSGTDVTALLPDVTISEKAKISPSGVQDFTEPVIYTVTAEDGSNTNYEVTLKVALSDLEILTLLYQANPDNSLNWNLNEEDLSKWEKVTTDEDGRVMELDFRAVNLRVLPPEIGKLEHLKRWLLGSNSLTTLPNEIGQLSRLESLGLHANDLQSLPAEIANLKNLKSISLPDNPLGVIPSAIFQLEQLEQLDLNRTGLTSIPKEIANLENLQWLYLGFNQIDVLQSELLQLGALRILGFRDNLLKDIPSSIEQLSYLVILDLRGNLLSAVPPQIGNLTFLEVLFLENNALDFVPPEMGNYTRLRHLYLEENPLKSLPAKVCQMTLDHGTNIYIDSGVNCE